jgi:hypothetical protein
MIRGLLRDRELRVRNYLNAKGADGSLSPLKHPRKRLSNPRFLSHFRSLPRGQCPGFGQCAGSAEASFGDGYRPQFLRHLHSERLIQHVPFVALSNPTKPTNSVLICK